MKALQSLKDSMSSLHRDDSQAIRQSKFAPLNKEAQHSKALIV